MSTYLPDSTDLGILDLLQKDSGISHAEIAERMNLSVNPIHTRIRRLKKEGHIKKYTVILDHKKIGKGLIVYNQVQLEKHSEKSLKTFMQEAVKLDEVMECYHMTGSFDFLLRIAISDMEEYSKLLLDKLAKLPEVRNMNSVFVMTEAKHETAYVLGK